MSYKLLLGRVPTPREVERDKLDPKDFPHIDYWYKHQWMAAAPDHSTKTRNEESEKEDVAGTQRGQGRSRMGINVAMRYIQTEDGTVIDGYRATEMRHHARAVFIGLVDNGKQFASWGEADAMSRRVFYNEMASRFTELSYCELDWKAEQIATDTYPGWKLNWTNKEKRSRQESVPKTSHHKRLKGPESISLALTSLPGPTPKSTMPSIPSEVCSLGLFSAMPDKLHKAPASYL